MTPSSATGHTQHPHSPGPGLPSLPRLRDPIPKITVGLRTRRLLTGRSRPTPQRIRRLALARRALRLGQRRDELEHPPSSPGPSTNWTESARTSPSSGTPRREDPHRLSNTHRHGRRRLDHALHALETTTETQCPQSSELTYPTTLVPSAGAGSSKESPSRSKSRRERRASAGHGSPFRIPTTDPASTPRHEPDRESQRAPYRPSGLLVVRFVNSWPAFMAVI